MLKITELSLTCALMLSACATSVPVEVDCPPPPPLPEVLTESVSTPPSLVQRYERLTKEFSESLKQAVKP